MKPIRILMFGWEFPPYNSGGLGVACYGLAKALAKLGAKITFVLPKKVGVSADFCKLMFSDVDSHSIDFQTIDSPLKAYITSAQYAAGERSLYGSTLFEEVERYGREAAKIASKENFDVVHAHDWLSFKAGIAAKRVKNKPLVAHVHATEFDRTGGRNLNQMVYESEREGLHAADKIATVSGYTKNMVMSHYGIPDWKVSVVHNGIDINDYSDSGRIAPMLESLKQQGNKMVLFVGRITLQKGPDYFVQLARKVYEEDPDVYFVVSGSGDMEGRMLQDIAYYGLSDRFIFTGFLRGEELNQVYRAGDITIMCSVSEPFGIIPLESILNGAPVLISKQTGAGEVVSHTLKSDFWDIDDMADKVLATLRYSSLKGELLMNSSREAKMASWERAAEKCLSIYNELLGVRVYN